MASRIQYRRDTASNWTSENPVLASGEPGFETDSGNVKIGDGSSDWANLSYSGGGGGGIVGPDLTDINSITSEAATDLKLIGSANVTVHTAGDSGNADVTFADGSITVGSSVSFDQGFSSFQDSSVTQKLTTKKDANEIYSNATPGGGDKVIDASQGSLQLWTLNAGDISFTDINNASNGDHGRVYVKKPAANDMGFDIKAAGNIVALNGGGTFYLAGATAEDRYAAFDWQYIDGVAIVSNVDAPLYT